MEKDRNSLNVGNMVKAGDPVFSSYVYHTLDCLGYSKNIQASRIQAMNQMAMMNSRLTNDLISNVQRNLYQRWGIEQTPRNMIATCLAVGSAGDGVASVVQSDMDFMFILNDTICVDNPSYGTGFLELKPDYCDTPPGYVKLTTANFIHDVPGRLSTSRHLRGRSKSGRPYLSSALFKADFNTGSRLFPMTLYDGINDVKHTQSGPASTSDTSLGYRGVVSSLKVKSQIDAVPAFYYFGANALKQWVDRKRFNEWPPKSLKEAISISNVYAVAVGETGSATEDLEWRISYTEAEKILMINTNDTQHKVYALLKMICKEILQPKCPSVSSYMVKNVMFWTFERLPAFLFVPTQLIRLVMHALWFFRHSLRNGHLPNYFVPERNLISGRIRGQEKRKLIFLLSSLLEERERIILRLSTLSDYLSVMRDMPHICTLYGLWRDRGEQLVLLKTVHDTSHLKADYFDKRTAFLDSSWESIKDENHCNIIFPLLMWTAPDLMTMLVTDKVQEAINIFQKRFDMMMLAQTHK